MLNKLLDDPRSLPMQFLGVYMNSDAVAPFVIKLRGELRTPSKSSRVQQRAFGYLVRWHYENFYPTQTLGWISATRYECQDDYAKLVWQGNFNPDQRIQVALQMASIETGESFKGIDVTRLERWQEQVILPEHWQRFLWQPTFAASDSVHGAHCSMIIDSTMVELLFNEFDPLDLYRAIMHLTLDTHDALQIRQVMWLSPFGRFSIPVSQLCRNLPAMRLDFPVKMALQPLAHRPKFDRSDTSTVGFYHHDLEALFDETN